MGSTGETDPLGDIPLPVYLTAQDVQFAVRAVVVHAAEQWPAGTVCRNDRSPFPCRLHRWGRAVLTQHGMSDPEIDALTLGGGGPPHGAPAKLPANDPLTPSGPFAHNS